MYPIIDITGKPAQLISDPDYKDLCENYWVRIDKYTKVLFKYTPFMPYQHYAEKIAYEIINLLGIECAKVDLARMGNKVGCISYSFLKRGEEIRPYADIAFLLDRGYSKFEDYSINYILESIKKLKSSPYKFDFSSKRVFEMVLADYLIANTDRHDENFGVIINKRTEKIKRAAPLFDHGFSLGLRTNLNIIKKCLNDPDEFQKLNLDLEQHIDAFKRYKLSYQSYADTLVTSYFYETEKIIRNINTQIVSRGINNILNGFDKGLPDECREFAKRIVFDRKNYLVNRYEKERLVRETHFNQGIAARDGVEFNRILENISEHSRLSENRLTKVGNVL